MPIFRFVQGSIERRQLAVLPSYDNYDQNQWPAWFDNSEGAVGMNMPRGLLKLFDLTYNPHKKKEMCLVPETYLLCSAIEVIFIEG